MSPHISAGEVDLAKSVLGFATALISFLAVLGNRNLAGLFKKINY
jgi:hypothetical protein